MARSPAAEPPGTKRWVPIPAARRSGAASGPGPDAPAASGRSARKARGASAEALTARTAGSSSPSKATTVPAARPSAIAATASARLAGASLPGIPSGRIAPVNTTGTGSAAVSKATRAAL